jgi:uncharacterized protein YbjT (DUF2867 family)
MAQVFIAGGTGYMGRRLVQQLLDRGHRVHALARSGSEKKLPSGCAIVSGNPLAPSTFTDQIAPADTYVHLVGVAHPSPSKSAEFKEIDLKSIELAVPAAVAAKVQHFVYVSVAHPAPMMKAYIEVRSRGEELIRSSGINATIVRPWYVLGPGHRWPYLLKPFYFVCERIPSTAEGARRLGLVTLPQMIGALTRAVEDLADGVRIVEVPEIRSTSSE